MNLHVCYQFQDGDRSGFGDVTIGGMLRPMRNAGDIATLKERIKAELAKDGMASATVVVGWSIME